MTSGNFRCKSGDPCRSGYFSKKAGITFDEVDNCYLAGGFGTKIDIKKAAGIGLIPKELEMKTIPAGNTVLAGTKEVLLSRNFKRRT